MTPCVASEEASAILPALTKLIPIFCCLFIDNVMIFLSLVKFVRGCRVSRRPHQEKLKILFYTFFHFFSLFCKKVKKVKKRKVLYLSNYFFNQCPKVHALLQVKSLQ